jgi:hypothetical protein
MYEVKVPTQIRHTFLSKPLSCPTSIVSSWNGGAWISPQGEWYDLSNNQEHYKFVLDNPDLFGFPDETVRGLLKMNQRLPMF